MKNIYIFIVAIGLYGTLQAQKKKTESPTTGTQTQTVVENKKPSDALYRTVLYNALKYNDLTTAIQSCHYLIILNPDQVGLKDTLAILYFESRQMIQSISLCSEILDKNPQNQKILEVQAISYQSLGMSKESLESYEKLYKLSKSVFHLYQIASLQYVLKRLGECEQTLSAILADPNSEKEKINVIIGNGQAQQEVAIKAAALNMAGVISMEQNKNDVAKKFFEEALKVDEKFLLPKGNLEYLNNPKKDSPKK